MGWLILADWFSDGRAALRDFYLFTKLDPGSAFVVLAVAMLVGRKLYRHMKKTDNYTLKDIRKYPGEMVEIGAIALLLIVGLFIKAAC